MDYITELFFQSGFERFKFINRRQLEMHALGKYTVSRTLKHYIENAKARYIEL